MQPDTSCKPTIALQLSRNSPPASAPPPLMITITSSPVLHHLRLAPAFPAVRTATLLLPSARLAIARAVLVSDMASPVVVTVSSWIVEEHDVVTVMIPALAVHLMMSTFLQALDVTASLSDDKDERFWRRTSRIRRNGRRSGNLRKTRTYRTRCPFIYSYFTRFAWHVDMPPHTKLKPRPAVMVF